MSGGPSAGIESAATTGIVSRSAMNARTTPMAVAPLDVDWLRATAFVLP